MSENLQLCYHCGNPITSEKLMRDAHAFCCEGCATVYSLLAENNLTNYYDLNVQPGKRQDKAAGRYDILDDEKVASRMREFQDGNRSKITFQIPAIHCTSCIWLLERLFRIHPAIVHSEVNFPRRELHLTYDHNKIKLSEIGRLLDVLGYAPSLSMADASGENKPKTDRSLWFRLGVSGFCFGNIMLLSFPEYLGLQDLFIARFFGYANIALSLPVVFYSGWIYVRSAWNGLRQGLINMDVPISMGLVALFVRSVIEILFLDEPGYMDSLGGLVFFLLLGKIYQSKTFDALNFERDFRSYFPISVTRLTGGKEENVPVSDLHPGDRIQVRNGELVPADAILIKGRGAMDYSFVTGESEPTDKQSGELLYAGGRQTGAMIEVELVKDVSQSYLTRLWNHEAFRKKEEAGVTQYTNRVGKRFTLFVIALSAVAGTVWAFIDPGMAVNVVTAILIVACPCALSISIPFTLGHTMRVFGKNKFYLKGIAAVEAIAEADTIVLDKTGTLTHASEGWVRWEGEALSGYETQSLRSLFRHSTHPLSRRVMDSLPPAVVLEAFHFSEEKGKGLEAVIDEEHWKAGSAAFTGAQEIKDGKDEGASIVWVRKGDHIRGRFLVGSHYREDLKKVLTELSSDLHIAVLTGDSDREKAQLGMYLPEKAEVRYRQSPQDKLDYIRNLQAQGHKVIMVGDGLNDAGALRQSDAGISVAEDISAFTPGSDGILSGASFSKLPELVKFSRSSMKVIRRCFFVSFGYNLTGLAFAVTGYLTPLVGAVLMPLSSVSVVLFTVGGITLLAKRKKLI